MISRWYCSTKRCHSRSRSTPVAPPSSAWSSAVSSAELPRVLPACWSTMVVPLPKGADALHLHPLRTSPSQLLTGLCTFVDWLKLQAELKAEIEEAGRLRDRRREARVEAVERETAAGEQRQVAHQIDRQQAARLEPEAPRLG